MSASWRSDAVSSKCAAIFRRRAELLAIDLPAGDKGRAWHASPCSAARWSILCAMTNPVTSLSSDSDGRASPAHAQGGEWSASLPFPSGAHYIGDGCFDADLTFMAKAERPCFTWNWTRNLLTRSCLVPFCGYMTLAVSCVVKGKISFYMSWRHRGPMDEELHAFMTSDTRQVVWSAKCPGKIRHSIWRKAEPIPGPIKSRRSHWFLI